MNDFELERQQRIETNRKRMLEMGIQAMASKIQAPATVPAPPVRARPFQTHQSNPFLFPARLHPERRAASLDDDTRGVAASRAPIRSGLHRATSLIIVQSGFLYFIHIARARITPMTAGARRACGTRRAVFQRAAAPGGFDRGASVRWCRLLRHKFAYGYPFARWHAARGGCAA